MRALGQGRPTQEQTICVHLCLSVVPLSCSSVFSVSPWRVLYILSLPSTLLLSFASPLVFVASCRRIPPGAKFRESRTAAIRLQRWRGSAALARAVSALTTTSPSRTSPDRSSRKLSTSVGSVSPRNSWCNLAMAASSTRATPILASAMPASRTIACTTPRMRFRSTSSVRWRLVMVMKIKLGRLVGGKPPTPRFQSLIPNPQSGRYAVLCSGYLIRP